MNQEPDQTVLVLVRDLLFSSKITATARAVGTAVKVIRDPLKLGGQAGRRLLVDLSLPGAIEAAEAWKTQTHSEVIGFVSHVDTETAARAHGVMQVMTRGGFTAKLEAMVR